MSPPLQIDDTVIFIFIISCPERDFWSRREYRRPTFEMNGNLSMIHFIHIHEYWTSVSSVRSSLQSQLRKTYSKDLT